MAVKVMGPAYIYNSIDDNDDSLGLMTNENNKVIVWYGRWLVDGWQMVTDVTKRVVEEIVLWDVGCGDIGFVRKMIWFA